VTEGKREDAVHGERPPSEGVLIDIGGAIGALVVHTPDELEGAEIEICPVGTTARTHTIVRARELPAGGIVYAGVFPSLPEGDYVVLPWGTMPETTVHIDGGAISQLNW
jgi:hypothetical protein